MSATPAAIVAESFCVLRDEQPVFAPVSFTLDFGATGCLSGANGSGKSTLLRALAGLPHESSGHAQVQPTRDTTQAGSPLFIAHRSGLSRRLTGRENLAFYSALAPPGSAAADRDVNHALDRVGLALWADEAVATYSAGQRRRLALARLLIGGTGLWLLDEPAANLDPAGRELLDALIDDHVAGGGAVLLSSHHSRDADIHCRL